MQLGSTQDTRCAPSQQRDHSGHSGATILTPCDKALLWRHGGSVARPLSPFGMSPVSAVGGRESVKVEIYTKVAFVAG